MGYNLRMQANEDKAMLIESMKKLTTHISNNTKRQLDIFTSLSLPDLQKILLNLQDANEDLRRVSALLLCEMCYRCDQIKKKLVGMLRIYPAQGRISLGGFPNLIARFPSLLRTCLELLRAPIDTGESEKFCWLINLDEKTLKLQWIQTKRPQFSSSIDPKRMLFGFTLSPKRYEHSPSPAKQKSLLSSYQPYRLNSPTASFAKTVQLEKTFRHKEKQKLKTEVSSTEAKRQQLSNTQTYKPSSITNRTWINSERHYK